MTVSQKKNKASDLTINNVSKTFGEKRVLDTVDLEVQSGKFVCFLGPSGCGKTTLLRIIAGLESLSSGQISMCGQDITNNPIQSRDIAIVFQSYALFPNLTVKQNVAYGVQGRKNGQKLVSELIQTVGLQDYVDSLPSQLSGGQQQRVALARALAVKPKFLLLDEPLSALDKNIRDYLRIEIKKLHLKFNLTTIMVTHDQEEALTMADVIVVMNEGKVEQIGTPAEIYKTPATKFVANFIGSMSFLTKKITGLDKVVGIRDEDCIVNIIGDPEGGIKGVVDSVDFLGSHSRLHITIDGDDVVKAIIPNGMLRGRDISVGDFVKVSFPKNKWHIYE